MDVCVKILICPCLKRWIVLFDDLFSFLWYLYYLVEKWGVAGFLGVSNYNISIFRYCLKKKNKRSNKIKIPVKCRIRYYNTSTIRLIIICERIKNLIIKDDNSITWVRKENRYSNMFVNMRLLRNVNHKYCNVVAFQQ